MVRILNQFEKLQREIGVSISLRDIEKQLTIAIAFLLPINPSLMQQAKSFPFLGVSEPLRKICQEKAARGRNEFDSKLTYDSCLKNINEKFNAKLKEVMPEIHDQCSEKKLSEYSKEYKTYIRKIAYDEKELKKVLRFERRDRDSSYLASINPRNSFRLDSKYIHLSHLDWSKISSIIFDLGLPSKKECKKSIKKYYFSNPTSMRTQKHSHGKNLAWLNPVLANNL